LRAAQQLRRASSAKALEPRQLNTLESGKVSKTSSTRSGSAGISMRPPARPSTSSGVRR
jgi:hypothetical protein